jgi:hypothetical protein
MEIAALHDTQAKALMGRRVSPRNIAEIGSVGYAIENRPLFRHYRYG